MSRECYGQWKQLFQFSSGVRTIYFLDQVGHPEIGFAGLFGGEIWRTIDQGQTWIQIQGLPQCRSIADITFKDSKTGWFVTKSDPVKNPTGLLAVFKTIDGGNSWQVIKRDEEFSAIYYFKGKNRLFLSIWSDGGYFSDDEGSTWQKFGTTENGYAFTDQNNGICGFDGSGQIGRTTDGGNNWNFNQIKGCWQPVAKPGTTTFFLFSEYDHSLYRSDNVGSFWKMISTLSAPQGRDWYEFTGCARLSLSNKLFVQSASVGLFTSNDEGLTWQGIGGPSNLIDSRFWVNCGSVFAGDENGGIWSYGSNTGSSILSINQGIINLHTPDCRIRDTVIYFHSTNCSNEVDSILSASINNGNSYSINTNAKLPRSIVSDDSIRISYHPSGVGIDTGLLTLRFIVGGKEMDTILNFFGVSLSRTVPLVMQVSTANLLSQNCDSISSTINYFSNACLIGVDSIENATFIGSNAFSLDGVENVPRRFTSNDSIRIKYFSTNAGIDTAFLSLHFSIHEKEVDTIIRFIGSTIKPYSTFRPQLNNQTKSKQILLQPGKDTAVIFSLSNDIAASSGLDSLTFDLKFNSNMLNLDSANAQAGWKIKISKLQPGWYTCWFYNSLHSDISANQALAYFYFSSYLTKDTISSVSLKAGNVFFDPLKHTGCTVAAMPQDDSVIIHAADTCGDPSLRHFLSGQPILSIISMRPNPAANEINLELAVSLPCDADLLIIDELGSICKKLSVNLNGARVIPISLEMLATGEYHILIRSEFGSISAPFIKMN